MDGLREAAQRLLNAGLEPKDYSNCYDEFLWIIVTSPREHLAMFAKLFFDDPFVSLPPALQVAVFRIIGLGFPGDRDAEQLAKAGIAMYCSPKEEANALDGIGLSLPGASGSEE